MALLSPPHHGAQQLKLNAGRRRNHFSSVPSSAITRRKLPFSPAASPITPGRKDFFSLRASQLTGLRTPLCSQRVQYGLSKSDGSFTSSISGHSYSSSDIASSSPDPILSRRVVKSRVVRRPSQNRLHCTECCQSFTGVAYLLRHFKAAHIKPEYPCPFSPCTWVYLSWDSYVKHCTVDHKSAKKPWAHNCEYEGCGRNFKSWKFFLEHLRDHQYYESRRSTSIASILDEGELEEDKEHRLRASRCSFTPEDRARFNVPTSTTIQLQPSGAAADPSVKQELEDTLTQFISLPGSASTSARFALMTPNTRAIAKKYHEEYPAYQKLHQEIMNMLNSGAKWDYEKFGRLFRLQQKMQTMRSIVCGQAGEENLRSQD